MTAILTITSVLWGSEIAFYPRATHYVGRSRGKPGRSPDNPRIGPKLVF